MLRAVLSRAGMFNRVAETLVPKLSGGCLAILLATGPNGAQPSSSESPQNRGRTAISRD